MATNTPNPPSTPPLRRARKNWIVLATALALGGLAAYAASNYLSERMAEIDARAAEIDTVQVVVAKASLPAGASITADTVAVREIPRIWAHSGAITPDQYSRAESLALAYPAAAGEPILWAQLEGRRAPTFSARLQSGQRAVTVPVDEISSLSGMVEPGDRIDIVVSARNETRNFTFTLLQNVAVLATGSHADPDARDAQGQARSYTTITLDTSPEDAKRVIAAREVGRVTALLRAPSDLAAVSGAITDARTLLGLPTSDGNGISSVPVIYGGGPITSGLQMMSPARAPGD
ncbi:MAG TPA: Flp pilus assembly protein CpaB [Thauera sp.]|nr:Flp pilus assembly protein CpaB [Thauera sp.]HHW64853.1 Flp pilus assembly protein CpaB [Rhodocyclaceae bacterium]